MEDLSGAPIEPASTTLEADISPAASGAGIPRTLDDEPSLRDTIAGVVKEQTEAAEKAEAPAEKGAPEPEEKPDDKAEEKAEPKPKDRDDKGKFAKAEQPKEEPGDKPADDQPKDEQPKAEKPRHPEAPQRFMPRAKELWPNVPNEVKAEVARMTKEHEGEVAQAREFIAPLVRYHQMAQQAGTSLPEALDRYVNMEQALRNEPAQGFRALLGNMQMEPAQAIGHILKAFNVTPQQLAEHIGQDPNFYAPRQVQQAPREDPRVPQLQQELATERANSVRAAIVEPFAQAHPRYNELEPHIAQLLKSGMVPDSLDPIDRLAAAYDMAVRLNPSAPSEVVSPVADDAPTSRTASDLGGRKSIKSAPGAVSPEMEPERGGSIREILEDEVRRSRMRA